MRSQEAATVVALPMKEVERRLRQVEGWPQFLIGVEQVSPMSHERYLFSLADGRDRRDAVVLVRWHHDTRCMTWRALDGPMYKGSLTVKPVDDRHTAVELSIAAHPSRLGEALAEMAMPRMFRARHDLDLLENHLLGQSAH
jgi:hypothetical protein